MTINQFLAKLRHYTSRKKIKWELRAGHIRCGRCCPLTIFSGHSASCAYDEGEAMGIDRVDVPKIVSAADWPSWQKDIRVSLLSACGLKEEAK